MKKVHFIWAHPRTDSLTAQVVDTMKSHARSKDLTVSELDLYRLNFNPVMYPPDEPQWDGTYPHTDEVLQLFESLKGIDTLFIVFPVWWYSFPAILKGYIDRVWSNGLAFGNNSTLPVNKIRWICLAGESAESYQRKGNKAYMENMMNINIAEYCGVADSEVVFLYNTVGFDGGRDQEHYNRLLTQANQVVDEVSI